MKLLPTAVLLTALAAPALSGPVGYGICQGGCAAVVMACYGAAGAVWGATAGVGAPVAVLTCNAGYATCQSTCAAVLLVPLP